MPENKKMVNGKVRNVHTGKKGGKYYVSKGKKVYFGNTKRSRSIPSSSSNSNRQKRKRTKRSSPRIAQSATRMPPGANVIVNLGMGLTGVARCAGRGANSAVNFASAALGRTLQSYPYARSFATGITMPVAGPRNQDGIGCEYMGEFKEDCQRNFCIREPQSRWCKETKQELNRITGGDMTRNLFMRRLLDGPRGQLNNQSGRPNKRVGDVIVTTLQRALRNKKFRNEQQEATRRIMAYYNSLPAWRRDDFMNNMYNDRYQPQQPMNYPQLLFGKKKAKRNTKKKTKQTRK